MGAMRGVPSKAVKRHSAKRAPQSTNQPLETALRSIVSEELGIEETEINDSFSFTIDGGADSLDVVSIIVAIERKFFTGQERLLTEDRDEPQTFGELVSLVKENQTRTV